MGQQLTSQSRQDLLAAAWYCVLLHRLTVLLLQQHQRPPAGRDLSHMPVATHLQARSIMLFADSRLPCPEMPKDSATRRPGAVSAMFMLLCCRACRHCTTQQASLEQNRQTSAIHSLSQASPLVLSSPLSTRMHKLLSRSVQLLHSNRDQLSEFGKWFHGKTVRNPSANP